MRTSSANLFRLRFILNTFYSGPQAWFFLADDRGYFRDEGLAIDFTEGDTLANAVPKLADGLFDAGYGDMNALVEWATARPVDAPIGVYAMHNRSPYTIAVPALGPVRSPKDLVGRTLVTHPNDAAWRMFPEFCMACGIDPRQREDRSLWPAAPRTGGADAARPVGRAVRLCEHHQCAVDRSRHRPRHRPAPL